MLNADCDPQSPVISCENVSLTFHVPERTQRIKDLAVSLGRGLRSRSFDALKDVDFDLGHSEILGVIGDNGAGKSTLLRVLGGVYRPDSGQVSVRGRIGMMLELGAGFHPDLSGRENVYINASLLGLSGKLTDDQFNRIVDWAELQEFIDLEVRHFSSGMRARLGFSIAVEMRPDVLLMDEVLSVGDNDFRRRCDEKFQEFVAERTTVVLVTHSLSVVEERCTKALWLHKGRVQEFGDPEYVLGKYRENITRKHVSLLNQEKVSRENFDEPSDTDTVAHEAVVGMSAPQVAEQEAVEVLPLFHPADRESQDTGTVQTEQKRWGTGKIRITRLFLRAGSGEQKLIFHPGETMRIDLHYHSHSSVRNAYFGVQISDLSGNRVTGANQLTHGGMVEQSETEGAVCIFIENLPLSNGAYVVSPLVLTIENDVRVDHDVRQNLLRFDIAGGPRWNFGPAWCSHVKFHHIKGSGRKVQHNDEGDLNEG